MDNQNEGAGGGEGLQIKNFQPLTFEEVVPNVNPGNSHSFMLLLLFIMLF